MQSKQPRQTGKARSGRPRRLDDIDLDCVLNWLIVGGWNVLRLDYEQIVKDLALPCSLYTLRRQLKEKKGVSSYFTLPKTLLSFKDKDKRID